MVQEQHTLTKREENEVIGFNRKSGYGSREEVKVAQTGRLHFTKGFGTASLLETMCPEAAVHGLHEPKPHPGQVGSWKLKQSFIGMVFNVMSVIVRKLRNFGFIALRGNRVVNPAGVKVLENMFPKAVDFAAYAPSVCAPLESEVTKDFPAVFGDITSRDSDGNTILADVDGSGIIDSSLSTVPIQIRVIEPITGLFSKGMLFPRDGVADGDGNPCARIDWLQVKGKWKSRAKTMHGSNSGAFGPDGVLVDESKLQTAKVEGLYCGILQSFRKPGRIRSAYSLLERVRCNDQTKAVVLRSVTTAIKTFHESGGVNGLLKSKAGITPLFGSMCRLSETLGLNPMRLSLVENYVTETLGAKKYHLAQGAGISMQRYVVRHDAGVPEGHVVAKVYRKDGTRVKDGESLAIARFPIILDTALKELVLINPRKELHSHLNHLIVGNDVTDYVITINPSDSSDMQADDDGDTCLVSPEADMLTLVRNQVGLFTREPGGKLLIEPEKTSDNPKGKIEVAGTSDIALNIIANDTQGPVGLLTEIASYFIALGMYDHAVAAGVAIQESIDCGKHAIVLSDLDKLLEPSNWIKTESGKFKPVNCQADSDSGWLADNGTLCIRYLSQWVKAEVVKFHDKNVPQEEVLQWKRASKRVDHWDNEVSPGTDLVNWSNYVSSRLWNAYESEHITSLEAGTEVNIVERLTTALGVKANGWVKDPSSGYYKWLCEESGLSAYGKRVAKLMKGGHTREERDVEIDAAKAALGESLRAMDAPKLLTIFATEMFKSTKDKDNSDRYVNRAFRAICFVNSPILKQLGIDEEASCSFLAKGMIQNHMLHINESVSSGAYASEAHALIKWPSEFNEIHEAETGIPLDECKHCKDLMRAKMLNHVRAKNSGNNSAKQLELGKLISAVNSCNH